MAQVIADFEDDAQDWRVITDQVMGGLSEGNAVVRRDGEVAFLELTGTVSTANNGGFIQARYGLPAPWPQNAQALKLRVRGDGQRYFIHLKLNGASRPWHYYQAPFDTEADWHEVVLPFAGFRPSRDGLPQLFNPADVASIALVAYGRDHRANVALNSIELE